MEQDKISALSERTRFLALSAQTQIPRFAQNDKIIGPIIEPLHPGTQAGNRILLV
jgi:hypothetical protein